MADTMPQQSAPPSAPLAPAAAGGKPGAPRKNRNRLRHGLRGIGWPKGSRHRRRCVNATRAAIEAAIREATGGEIDITAAAAVNVIYQWARHGELAAAWLAQHGAQMDPETKLSFSREIAKAAENVQKAVQGLRLDRDPDAFDFKAFYARPYPPMAPNVEPAVGDAKPGDDNPMPLVPTV